MPWNPGQCPCGDDCKAKKKGVIAIGEFGAKVAPIYSRLGYPVVKLDASVIESGNFGPHIGDIGDSYGEVMDCEIIYVPIDSDDPSKIDKLPKLAKTLKSSGNQLFIILGMEYKYDCLHLVNPYIVA